MPTKDQVIEAMKNVQDPELQLDVWSLGLIYDIKVEGDIVKITMSLTSPVCPYGPELIENVKTKASEVEGVKDAEVELTFSPPWGPDRMSDEARMALGL